MVPLSWHLLDSGCVKRKLNISFPATRLTEVGDELRLSMFKEKHMATELAADALGKGVCCPNQGISREAKCLDSGQSVSAIE